MFWAERLFATCAACAELVEASVSKQQFPLDSSPFSQKLSLMFFYGNHFIAHKKSS
jgi:hypothetical protein